MPRMSNGIGTWFCRAGFDAGWGWDDAVECAMFVFFPVWALRVVHVKVTPGGSFAPDKYDAIPLRWSDALVQHVMLRRWFGGLIGLGLLILLMLGLVTLWPPTGNGAKEWAVTKPILTPLAPCLVLIGIGGLCYLRPHTRRARDIRRLLGAHALGTADPTTWVDEDRARAPTSTAYFGSATFADAVPKMLELQCWTGAMWAARLATAFEDEAAGEALTDKVLQQDGLRQALARFRADRNSWFESMGGDRFQSYRRKLIESATGASAGENDGNPVPQSPAS
jgi:hypothetical protein